jgi:O-methyltransferase
VHGVRHLLAGRRPASRPTPVIPTNSHQVERFDFHIDVCTADAVAGWVVHPDGIEEVRVLLQGSSIGNGKWGVTRPDVALGRPDLRRAFQSGFAFVLPDDTFAVAQPQQVVIEFTAGSGSVLEVERQVWPVYLPGGDPVQTDQPPSSLPADVTAALVALRPDAYEPVLPWSSDMVGRAIADIERILRAQAPVKPILRYALYLRSMADTFGFIAAHFDRTNRSVGPEAKDFQAVASSPQEMLCIANHLYVLRSHGVTGGLVECGCFKGFSTCCLSQACSWLRMRLHVFDSFEGLPPSEGDYYQEGDFCGSVEEVTDNLRTFGQPEVVELHKGFFAETLPLFHEPVSCIWMDVDLESSAKDVMALLPALPSKSCVFSHECPPESFVDSRPRPQTSEVLPPIVDAFRAIDADPVGRHLTGFLGSVWSEGRSLPVLGQEAIERIVIAATS